VFVVFNAMSDVKPVLITYCTWGCVTYLHILNMCDVVSVTDVKGMDLR
jgi:hypothetical protein